MRNLSTESTWLKWGWIDQEIENPKLLRETIEQAEAMGFSGLWAVIDGVRYDATDRKVIQAAAQASQWARCRGIAFWISADPRQASRSLIARSGERADCLVHHLTGTDPATLPRVLQNRFSVRMDLPAPLVSPWIQDQAVQFIPSGLERVFLFKIRDSRIQADTVRDVTGQSRIDFNLIRNEAEIFGEASCSEDEDWRVLAFVRFETNSYDFAGMVSTDLLYNWMENLFDAGACLDGLAWDRPGYPEIGFPISRSLIGCFNTEFGYDVRDALFGLALPVDNGSHVRIRCDYRSLVWQVVAEAHRRLHSFAGTFFGSIHAGILYAVPDSCDTSRFSSFQADPWAELKSCTVGLVDVDPFTDENRVLAACALAKSLGVFSKGRRALMNMPVEKGEFIRALELASLFSVEGLIETSSPINAESGLDYSWLNQRMATIHELTQNHFPEANVAVVYPIDTLRAAEVQTARQIRETLSDWISRLIRSGIQMDMISPGQFQKGRLSSEGFRVGQRFYDAVLYPYPEIMTPEALEILSWMKKKEFPILLGGSRPEWTTTGKCIPHQFDKAFDPTLDGVPNLMEWGVPPLLSAPAGALATVIRFGWETVFLLVPGKAGEKIQGEAEWGGVRFEAEAENLTVYSILADRAVRKL